jgi:hypothetical protein
MAKKKKFQSGAASVLDDPNILDVLPQIQKPNLQSDQVGDIRALLPLLAMGVTAATPGMINKFGQDVRQTPGGIVLGPDAEELSKERDRIAKEGKPGGFSAPDIKLPISTGSPPPDPIEFEPGLIPPGDPLQGETKVGGGFIPTDMPDMSIMTMGDKKKESKALVKKTMMPTLDDLPDLSGDKNMAPRFNQTEDYIRSNYTGTEEKTIDQWVNELVDPQKGLTLELRDSGLAGVLLRLNSTEGDKKITSAQLLDEILNFPSQLDAFNIPGSDLNQASFKIMGNNQELFPQVLNTELNKIQNLEMVLRPGPVSDFMERYKDLLISGYQELMGVTDRDKAADILTNLATQRRDLMLESDVTQEMLDANRQYTIFEDSQRTVGQTFRNNVFTNEHMSIGLPGTQSQDYQVLTHNFKPAYDQDARLEQHNSSHPTADHTIAFSRGRQIMNDANNETGYVIMEMQSDVHRNLKGKDITFPDSINDASKNFYPFSGGQQFWVKQVLKDNIENAIIKGDSFVGWVPGEVVSVYEQADKDNYKGFKTIYNKQTVKFIERLNKDITKRAKQLGLTEEQAQMATLKIKNDGRYVFPNRDTEYGMMEGTARKYRDYINSGNYPGLEDYVREGPNGQLILINMPYVDLKKSDTFDPELFKRIGFPQFKKGGKTKSSKEDPLIDIEIFFESV